MSSLRKKSRGNNLCVSKNVKSKIVFLKCIFFGHDFGRLKKNCILSTVAPSYESFLRIYTECLGYFLAFRPHRGFAYIKVYPSENVRLRDVHARLRIARPEFLKRNLDGNLIMVICAHLNIARGSHLELLQKKAREIFLFLSLSFSPHCSEETNFDVP